MVAPSGQAGNRRRHDSLSLQFRALDDVDAGVRWRAWAHPQWPIPDGEARRLLWMAAWERPSPDNVAAARDLAVQLSLRTDWQPSEFEFLLVGQAIADDAMLSALWRGVLVSRKGSAATARWFAMRAAEVMTPFLARIAANEFSGRTGSA